MKLLNDIKGFEYLTRKYFLTSCGRIFILRKLGGYVEIKGSINCDGYIRIDLRKRNTKQGKMFFLHNLIMIYFYEYFGEVDHIDLNKLNNSLNNLRKANRSINCSNRNYFKRNTGLELIELVKELYDLGLSLRKIQIRTGLTYQQVRNRVKKINQSSHV